VGEREVEAAPPVGGLKHPTGG